MNEPNPESAPAAPDAPPVASRSREERRVQAAADVLRSTIRDLYAAHFGTGRTPDRELPVGITLRVRPSDGWALEFDPPLAEQLLPQLADAEAGPSYRSGRVFCFRCLSNDCEHAAPASPLHVFKGYDEQGRPEWHELAQALLDQKHERVDALFAKPPSVVAGFQYGRDLKLRQLSAFGKASLSYSILAQVVAGYFERGHGKYAVTIQAAEGRKPDRSTAIHLNVIVCGMDDVARLEWLASDACAPLYRSLQIAARELTSIEESVSTARAARDYPRSNQLMGRVPGVLRRLAEGLERSDRQAGRRTRHVEDRRKDQRPVHKALEDAAAAPLESCFFDEKARTFIVVGDRGRAHAFSEKGRHVTSFTMKPSAVAFRLRTHRWRPADAGAWSEIKRALTAGGRPAHAEEGEGTIP